MGKILTTRFFEQPTLQVAEKLLGKYLVRGVAPTRERSGSRLIAGMITEVEAYDGPHDRASHASRGQTKRNEPMFGPAGHWYVYFTYGMHWMLNIITREEGYPAAVLIRGVKLEKKDTMTRHSAERTGDEFYLDGPARITKFFKIDKRFNNKKAVLKNGLWIEDRPARNASRSEAGGGVRIPRSHIKRAARIGVPYAGPVWTKKRFRFYIEEKKR